MANKKGRATIKRSEKPLSNRRNFDTELFNGLLNHITVNMNAGVD